jgi:transcriptional regulator with XRE-family HTH domain
MDRMIAAEVLRMARRRSGLSSRALARRAGTSHATLLAYEAARKIPRVDTLERIVRAAGFEADVDLAPRPDAHAAEREAKGRELADALELAAQFPARHNRNLPRRRFGRAA